MITKDQQLNKDVMRRVYFIHVMRFFLNGEVLKGMVFGASTFFVVTVTHVTNVMANMLLLDSWASYPRYVYGAYLHTGFVVQAIIALALVAGAWLVVDVGRNVTAWVPGILRKA